MNPNFSDIDRYKKEKPRRSQSLGAGYALITYLFTASCDPNNEKELPKGITFTLQHNKKCRIFAVVIFPRLIFGMWKTSYKPVDKGPLNLSGCFRILEG